MEGRGEDAILLGRVAFTGSLSQQIGLGVLVLQLTEQVILITPGLELPVSAD